MKLLNYTLIQICLAFIGGIIYGFYCAVELRSLAFVLSLSGLSILVAKCYVKSKQLVLALSVVLFFIMGCFNTQIHLPKNDSNHLVHIDVSPNTVIEIKAEVQSVLKENQFNLKYFLNHIHINSKPYNGKLLLNVSKSEPRDSFEVGDKLLLFSELRPIESSKNPQAFDYKSYLQHKDVYFQISENEILVLSSNKTSFLALASRLRSAITSNLSKSGFENHHIQLMQALILGQKQQIDKALYNRFASVGIVHILAVSGLHIGILFLILNYLLHPILMFKYGFICKALITILILWVFAFVVGFTPSVVRAVSMFSCFALSGLVNRKTSSLNLLLLSAVVLLAFNPHMIFEVGFQLSYAAVFSIVCLYPVFSKLYRPKSRFIKIFSDTLAVSLAAQIGVLPFQLLYFHQFPTLFLLGNIIVIPLLGILLTGGIVCILLSCLGILFQPIFWIYTKTLEALTCYVDWLSKFDFLMIKEIYFTTLMSFFLGLVLFSVIFMFRQFNRRTVVGFLFSLSCFCTITAVEILKSKQTNELIVFHKNKSSIVGIKQEDKLSFFTNDTAVSQTSFLIKNYAILNSIASVEISDLKNELYFDELKLVIIDSSGIYIPSLEQKIIVLSGSPDIHFEKLLRAQPVSAVIADGSNYKSYVERWHKTSKILDIPFHSTYSSGYYSITSD